MQKIQPSDAHILMCGDSGYFQHIAACLVSLLESNSHKNFSVVVVATQLAGDDTRKLKNSLVRFKNLNLEVIEFDASVIQNLPVTAAYPPEIYVRFWVENYFSVDVERVIYLDGDMIIVNSIDPLLTVNLEDKVLAAVKIPGSDRPNRFGYDAKFGYFNSGMMVLNLVRWRQIDARNLLVNTAYSMAGKLNDPDQDVLNICFHDQYVPLDYVWNAISPFFKEINHLALSRDEIARVVKDARIVHFNGLAKPWQYLCFHPYAKRYLQCVAQTDWKGFKQADFNMINVVKKILISRLGERRAMAVSETVRRLLPISLGYRR